MVANAIFTGYESESRLQEVMEEQQYYRSVSRLDIKPDLQKLVTQATSALTKLANVHYKDTPFLESSEVEFIKESLNSYFSDDTRVNDFKRSLIDDLSKFQNNIKNNYVDRITTYKKKQNLCLRQIQIYETAKNELVVSKIAKALWPYNKQTQEYDVKIAALKSEVQMYQQKIVEAQGMRPLAYEKDILLCQLQLKDKLAKLFE